MHSKLMGFQVVLGQDQSRATEQSQGQSLAPAQHDQTKCPKPANKMMELGNPGGQPRDQPNVPAVMMPMSQSVGGWHVTSMSKQPRPAKCPTIMKNNAIG